MSNPIMTHAEAVRFFADLYRGVHHIPGRGVEGDNVEPYGDGWCITELKDMTTFHHNMLTRLVFLAHDRRVRAAISPAGRYLRIAILPRSVRVGRDTERHPTIDHALEHWRTQSPEGHPDRVAP